MADGYVRRTLQIDNELDWRIHDYMGDQGFNFSVATRLILKAGMDGIKPYVPEARVRYRDSFSAPASEETVTTLALSRCPTCGSDEFFDLLSNGRWRCDFCREEGVA